jgi:nitroimidazol reductase NimA-like FMN-containing flavoprotein (pyridoxamine 5'-phosphate oxidase superfamily)
METLGRDEALAILETASVAHLGMIDEGEPYVTPMSFVVSGNRVLFRTMAGRKLDALRENPAVCVEASQFDEETGDWKSVIVRGRAREVEEDALKQATVSMLLHKYQKVMGSPLGSGGVRPLADSPHFIEVEIEDVTGMSSGRGLSARTRPGRL